MLKTYYSNRLEKLSEKLAEILAEAPADPFEPEEFVVQNSGLSRWLALELADRLGVCANYEFRHPSEFQWFLLRRVLDQIPEVPAFSSAVLRWRIQGLIPRLAGEPCFAQLTGYTEELGERGTYQLSCRLADVFDRYLTYRPDWIRDWESGGGGDDWQAELWRRLTGHSSQLHRVDLLEALTKRLSRAAATGETVPGLPERVCVFGTPTLAPVAMDVLAKLAELTDVHLFLMNPCREYWGQISSPREVSRRCRDQDPAESYIETGNPLLAAFGRQGRAFLDSVLEYPAEEFDCYEEPGEDCLLHTVQSQILNLREPDVESRRPYEEHDRSVQIHSCHSTMREVQVLHDQLLSIFEESPDLTPSDVVVMTPDIERYSPLIDAVFSVGSGPRIPYNLADRSPTVEGRITRAFLSILELPDSRFEATRVLSLLDTDAIRGRFGIEREDMDQIRGWVKEAGIRWGVDTGDRVARGFPAGEEHTWRTGLDRLLLGYALPPKNGLFRNLLPLEAVEGESALVLGRFLSFAEETMALSRKLLRSRTPQRWSRVLLEILDTLFLVSDDDEGQLGDLRESVQKLAHHCEIAGFSESVDLDVVRAHFQLELRSVTSSGQFLSGGVTFCTLLPMRSVPFSVVCLLGMGQTTFPRQGDQPSFDLTARENRPGDRSKREDDRYLFLEALISARRYFYVSYVGQDQRDNAALSPSVLVSELLSSIKSGFYDVSEPTADVLEKVTTRHPLQPFSPSYFANGDRLFSYSRPLADATQALASPPRQQNPAFFAGDLPPTAAPAETIELDRLVRFLGHPPRFLLQQRMRIRLVEEADLLADDEPLVLEGLGIYRLRKALLDLRLSGRPLEDSEAVLRSAGLLPHGDAGRLFLGNEERFVANFVRRLQSAGFQDAGAPVPVDLEVNGIRVVGSLKNLTPDGLVEYRLGRSSGRDWLGLWTRHLALCCVRPSGDWSSRWIGADRQIRLQRVDRPEEHLGQLLRLYNIGRNRPLHLFSRTSLTYAQKVRDPRFRGDSYKAARRIWTGGEFSWGESNDRYHELAFRGRDPLDDDFRECALSVFEPIFAHEFPEAVPGWLQ